jgi:hypothetical protein
MSTRTLEETIEIILREYDAELILEALEIEAEELLRMFEDRLLENLHKFELTPYGESEDPEEDYHE